jgi:hypothetical protein
MINAQQAQELTNIAQDKEKQKLILDAEMFLQNDPDGIMATIENSIKNESNQGGRCITCFCEIRDTEKIEYILSELGYVVDVGSLPVWSDKFMGHSVLNINWYETK